MKIEIKNSHVLPLANWLSELNLNGRQSRERTRFVKTLANRHQENEKFRMELVEKYAKKDKKGKIVKTEDGENIQIEKIEEFTKEATDLYEEKFVVDLLDESYEILKDIVLNTNYVFGPNPSSTQEEKLNKIRQANDYDVWCEIFEKK